MPTVTAEQVESRLSEVRCAVCKTNEFGIDRRTMQPDGEWKGVCLKCRYSFPVHADMEFYLRTQPDIPYRLKEIPCTACESRGVTLDFRIVLSVREAHYFVTCTKCHHKFHERSTLETFE
jgi:DNA-directed RNA polymerase subunit RPC12/RpoP